MKIFTGNSNIQFAQGVAKYLDIPLGAVDLQKFSDGELYVAFDENIRNEEVFIIQSTNPPAENILELLLMLDAARRASAKKVVAVDWYEFPGFSAAHKILDSKVEFRKYIIDENTLGMTNEKILGNMDTISEIKEKFDIVLLFGVLYHLPNPIMVMQNLLQQTNMLLIATHIIESNEPAMYYYPEGSLTSEDTTSWWIPTPSCLTDIGKRIGFEKSVLVDTFDFDSINAILQQDNKVKSGLRRIHKMGLFKMEGRNEVWKSSGHLI